MGEEVRMMADCVACSYPMLQVELDCGTLVNNVRVEMELTDQEYSFVSSSIIKEIVHLFD